MLVDLASGKPFGDWFRDCGTLRARIGVGLLSGLAYVLVRNAFPEALWPKVFGLLAGVWSVTVLIGPLIGGVFASYGHWRGAFVTVTGIGCLLGAGVYCRQGFSDDGVARLRRIDHLRWAGAAPETRGHAGNFLALELQALGEPEASPDLFGLFGPSRIWSSATPYLRPWHVKPRDRIAGDDALSAAQVRREWSLRWPDSPPPSVELLPNLYAAGRTTISRSFDWARTDRDCLAPDRPGFFRLTFEHPVSGPIALGRSAHFGLGLFVAERTKFN